MINNFIWAEFNFLYIIITVTEKDEASAYLAYTKFQTKIVYLAIILLTPLRDSVHLLP